MLYCEINNDKYCIFKGNNMKENSILVIKKNYILLVDSLLVPKDVKKIISYLQSKDIHLKYIINTHFHSDHCHGNRFFQVKSIIGHKDFQATIDSERRLIKSKRPDISKDNIRKPNVLVNKRMMFDDALILHTPGHTNDSLSIYFPDERTAVVGDLVLDSGNKKYALPYFFWGNINQMISSLQIIISLNPKVIIPGHGNPVCTEKLKIDLAYLQNLSNKIDDLHGKGDLDKLASIDVYEFLPKSISQLWNKQIHDFNLANILKKNPFSRNRNFSK